jgi:hypothetical protein
MTENICFYLSHPAGCNCCAGGAMTETMMAIGVINEITDIVAGWRNYLADTTSILDPDSRVDAYRRGVRVCADQLDETLERLRACLDES